MRTFRNAKETLEALAEEIAKERKSAAYWKTEFSPSVLVVALYRLTEVQLDYLLETGGSQGVFGSYEAFDAAQEQFAQHHLLGQWIREQHP